MIAKQVYHYIIFKIYGGASGEGFLIENYTHTLFLKLFRAVYDDLGSYSPTNYMTLLSFDDTLIGETFASPKTRKFFWINFRDLANRRNSAR